MNQHLENKSGTNHQVSCAMMNRLVLVVLVLLAGCGTPPVDNALVGRWQIAELEEVAERVVDDVEQLDSANSKMTIEFQSSGELKTVTAIGSINSEKVGTWKLLNHDTERGVMEIECVLQSQRTQHEIEFESDDLIRWVPPNMAGTSSRMQFERLK